MSALGGSELQMQLQDPFAQLLLTFVPSKS